MKILKATLWGGGGMLKNGESPINHNFKAFILRKVANLFYSKENLSKEWWNENT